MRHLTMVKSNRFMALCGAFAALFIVGAGAQEVVSARVTVSANHTEKVKKSKSDGFTWIDVQGKDTYRANGTFTLNTAPADWRNVINGVWVSVGDVSFSPDVGKQKAKGGKAKFKEKDKESKSTTSGSVKWSKNSVSFSMSGSNYDDDNIAAPDDDSGMVNEDIEITIDLGSITCEAVVKLRGKGSVKIKTVKTGRGEDQEIDDYELFNWRASGSGRMANGQSSGSSVLLMR